ncbi:MAG TPA: class I SAM-dependent methyltransferase [Acidimicrobiales bacterium]|nr:class I SAM-dependent methyltransferase [Acidimicrobiales bacterium]
MPNDRGADDNAAAWDRYAAAYQARAQLSTTAAHYGPDLPTETALRLLGDVKGKRVLELGCGGAQCSIAFAKQGATAIGVDFSAQQLAFARRLCEREDVRVELRQGDLADLAFLRADTIDIVFSANAFGYVDDLNRVFRQVHRVLKPGAPLVFSLPHPATAMFEFDDSSPLAVRRSYFDTSPMEHEMGGAVFTDYHHTFADIYMGLARSSYRVDLVVEPEPLLGGRRSPEWHEAFLYVPRTLIVRARKEGN